MTKRSYIQIRPSREGLKRALGIKWGVAHAIDKFPPLGRSPEEIEALPRKQYIRMCRENAYRWRAHGIPFLMWDPIDADVVPSSMWALSLHDFWFPLTYHKGAYWHIEADGFGTQASLDEYYSFASSVPLSRWPGDPPIETKPTPQLEPHFTEGETPMGHYHFSNPTPAPPPAPPALVPLPPSFTDLLMDKELRKRQPRFDPVPGNGIVYMTHAGTIYEVSKFVPGQSLQAIWQGYLQVAEPPPPPPEPVWVVQYHNVYKRDDGTIYLSRHAHLTREEADHHSATPPPAYPHERVGCKRLAFEIIEGQFDD
jgi:hypothetical protein